MAGEYGCEETKDVVVSVVSLANSAEKVTQDGWQWLDTFKMFPALATLPEAIKNIDKVPNEWSDWDPEDQAEIVAEIEKMNFESKRSEAIAELALKIGNNLGQLVVMCREARKS